LQPVDIDEDAVDFFLVRLEAFESLLAFGLPSFIPRGKKRLVADGQRVTLEIPADFARIPVGAGKFDAVGG
jgi:hypothetical protein